MLNKAEIEFGNNIKAILESYLIDEDIESDPVDEADIKLGDELKRIFQDIIDAEDLTEHFISSKSAKDHFKKHCIGENEKKSTSQRVLYDFKTQTEYEAYEKRLAVEIADNYYSGECTVLSFYDAEAILDKFKNFFDGEHYVNFAYSCGLESVHGDPVKLTVHNSCSAVTTNYNGKTIDYRISNSVDRTVTLFPIAADKLEKAINRAIRNYSKEKVEIKIAEN